MCLIAFGLDVHPKYRFILAGNRDEFFARPTAYLQAWSKNPDILGGRDLEAGGTWLAMNRSGQLSTLTNYRDPSGIQEEVKSRGILPTAFVESKIRTHQFMENVHLEADRYNGFNLLAYSFQEKTAFHYSNYERVVNPIQTGKVYGLSNALLDTSWPKVEKLKSGVSQVLNQSDFTHDELLDILNDRETAPDDALPSTGVPPDWEKALSAMFIQTEAYGTCCSSVITIDHRGQVIFTERSFPVGRRKSQTLTIQFTIQ